MKKRSTLIILITSILCSTVSSNDRSEQWESFHPTKASCVEEYILTTNISEELGTSCNVKKSLTLEQTYRNYPLMNQNPRRVNYWKGSYVKKKIIVTTTLRQLIDTCRGRVIDERTFTKSQSSELVFKLKNPNLDSSIKESYMLSPLSPVQAKVALVNALRECENYTE